MSSAIDNNVVVELKQNIYLRIVHFLCLNKKMENKYSLSENIFRRSMEFNSKQYGSNNNSCRTDMAIEQQQSSNRNGNR